MRTITHETKARAATTGGMSRVKHVRFHCEIRFTKNALGSATSMQLLKALSKVLVEQH